MSVPTSTGQQLAPAAYAPVPPELTRLLKAFSEAATPRERHDGFVHIVRWIREAHGVAGYRQIIEALQSDFVLRGTAQASLATLLHEIDSLALFAEVGLPSVHPFTTEIVRRIVGRILPSARHDTDAAKLLMDLYSREDEVERFNAQPFALFARTAQVLTPEGDAAFWERQLRDLHEAMRLLAARISGLGLAPEMRARTSHHGISRSPFYELIRTTEDLIASSHGLEAAACYEAWKQTTVRCRQAMEDVYDHMETEGISVELVFDLKTIHLCLVRMENIASVLRAAEPEARLAAVRGLLSGLAEGNLEDKRISSLLRENLNLLARKVVDRSGDTGEHYIASSRAEYQWMWRASLGGGLLTVITAAIKMRIVDAHLPLFFEGFLAGTNYAVSFIFLQVFGLALATKQPATTAAAFARIIRNNRGQQRSSRLADFVARITSTQLAAALGNVFAVSVGAVIFEWAWSHWFGKPYLADESARHVYETLHPFDSGTAFYAVVTGVILWLAALIGSWMENAAVYYDVAEAVAQHPLGVRISETASRRLSQIVHHNLGGWCTSIVLGYLLGFTPVLGAFFGMPLDVRHVTLSTGTLALAAARSGISSLSDIWFLYAVEGIGIVFVLNLTVSFLIALYVALRAYDIETREQLKILWSVLVSAVRSPLRFVLPQFGTPAKAEEDAGIS
jgi:site-specific recombinase